ncbi:restriction endonuclease subunit S [Prevotella nigrescens]|uniref:Type I restriction modification DNA specificity domain-containing protein n=1 Tax=Prevotella nigrescens CC14M TaxID=1073366 RepID=V8CNX0_9BACT|nr:restriction endonuclease subunit S [Prevotella nigrescens]ETD28730.1 hypothetical protein HMPREF1173_01222 [Prevotella nigrescens CC14M]
MEEYRTYTLEELSIGKGSYGIAASAVPFDSSLYTYLRITDINDDGSLNKSGLMSVDEDDAEKFLLKPNDIVFARTGNSTGRSYFYDGLDGELVYAGFLIKFSLDNAKVNPRILRYYTHSKPYFDWVQSFGTGSTRGNINAKTYGNMPITLPPRNIQDKIVDILKSLDDKIEINRRINDNLEQQAQVLFDEMFPHITEGENMIGDLIMPKRGKGLLSKNAVKGDIPVVAGGIEPATYHNQANTTAPVLTIAASGANAGYINLWHIPAWASDSSYIDKSITPNVYFWYVMLKKRQKEIFDAQVGSAQPHIYPKHIAELPIDNVSVKKIIEYNNIVTPLFEKRGLLILESKCLALLRDTLLPKLISGELNINETNN